MALKSDYSKMSRLLNQTAISLQSAGLAFHVHYWGAMPEHFDNPVHRHSFFEVCYVEEGEGTYIESDQSYPLSAGTLFCSRPGQWHQIKSQTGIALFFVAFELDEAHSKEQAIHSYAQLMDSDRFYIAKSEESMTALLWRMLFHLCSQDKFIHQSMMESLSHSLLVSFLPTFTSQHDSQTIQEPLSISPYLQRAKLFIEDNLASPLSLPLLSNYLYITERHITRLFAQEVGQSFSHYVQERRIQRATEYLLDTDWGISRIAQATGFESIHYFTRVFTKKMGVAPGTFRKTQLSEVPFSQNMS